MKFNEDELSKLATSPSSKVSKCGWLWKRGEVNRSWQKRYFKLVANFLFYYSDSKSIGMNGVSTPMGVIFLENVKVETLNSRNKSANRDSLSKYELSISSSQNGGMVSTEEGTGRTYHLAANSKSTCDDWVFALSHVSLGSLKRLVLTLESARQDATDKRGKNLIHFHENEKYLLFEIPDWKDLHLRYKNVYLDPT